MAKTKYDTPEDKQRLQERALALKPKQLGVIATELGWAIPQARGTLELLVSFKNLDELLGDAVSEVEQTGEPIVIAPEVIAEVPAAPVPEVPVAPAPKRPGPKPKTVKPVPAPVVEAPAPVVEPAPEAPAAPAEEVAPAAPEAEKAAE
jgi:hypothetical protein